MVAAVQADLVTGRGNVRKCIRKLRDAISADKKSRVYLPLGQSLQKLLGQFARRPVVERQRKIALRRSLRAQRLCQQRQHRKQAEKFFHGALLSKIFC